MRVLLYQDYVHNNGLLHRALIDHFGRDAVAFCDAADILDGALDDGVTLFVMPGGADLYYCEKLNGEGNVAIRAYVEDGGRYLGICAGAYYACERVDWAAGTDQAIAGTRELAFAGGCARGPIDIFIEDGAVEKSWRGAARLIWDDGVDRLETTAAYEAGPIFAEDAGTVLARYLDLPARPPAIVECKIGQGKALLCSPHIERAGWNERLLYRHRNPSCEHDAEIVEALAAGDAAAIRLRAMILTRAGR